MTGARLSKSISVAVNVLNAGGASRHVEAHANGGPRSLPIAVSGRREASARRWARASDWNRGRGGDLDWWSEIDQRHGQSSTVAPTRSSVEPTLRGPRHVRPAAGTLRNG